MLTNSEQGRLSTLSQAALSASLAFSFGALVVDDASAQTAPRNTGDVELETINVAGAASDEGEGFGDSLNEKNSSSVKATAPLLDTPKTVTVIPKQVLEERNAQTLVDALKTTPGITFDAGENGFASGPNQFNIRGFNSAGNIFVDGSRDNGSFTRGTFNVEGIEVVKGASADNGRGGAGGYINTVTKVPHLDNFYRGNVGIGFDEYDSDARWRGTADVNHQIGETTAIRLNAMLENGGLPGVEHAENNAWGFAPSVAFGLGTDFRAYLAYEHVERDDVPNAGVAINRAGPLNGVGIKGAGPRPYVKNLPRDTFFGGVDDFDKVSSDALLARFEYDINDRITISNQTRWSKVDRESEYHIANMGGLPLASTLNGYERDNETITNLTNLRAEFATGGLQHTLSTGLEFTSEKSDGVKYTGGTLAFAGTNSVDIDTAAFYIYDTIKLNEQWSVSAGLRAEHYEVSLSNLTEAGVPEGAHGYKNDETTLGGNIGVVYKPVDNGSLYASYGLSHLPHGSLLSNPDISRDSATNVFPGFVAGADPVELHNFEAGVKWDFFGGDLTTTAAIFRTEKHNVAYASGTDVVYGKQVVQGVEFGVAGKVTEAWSVFGGVTFLDSERKHGAAVDAAVSSDYSVNSSSHPDYVAVSTTNGDELAFTPKVSATLWTTYRWDNGFTLGGGVQYVGESWIGRPDDATRIIPNGKFGKLPDYFLVNLMAKYEVNENISVQLNVDNIFDETYLTTANWNGNWGYLGAPRTVWVSSSFKF